MGLAHAEDGRLRVFNGENGLPLPDKNGDYPLVVYPEWLEPPVGSQMPVEEIAKAATEYIDGKDSTVVLYGLHEAASRVQH